MQYLPSQKARLMNSPTSPHYYDLSFGKSSIPQTSALISSRLNLPHSKSDRLPFETDQTALYTDRVTGPNSLSVNRSVLETDTSEPTHESDRIDPLDPSGRVPTAATHTLSTLDTFSAPITPENSEHFPSSSATDLDYLHSIAISTPGIPTHEASTGDALFTGLADGETNEDAVIMLRSSLTTPPAPSVPLVLNTEASAATFPTGSGRQILHESSQPENPLTRSSRLDEVNSSSFGGQRESDSGPQHGPATYWTDDLQSSGTVDALGLGSTPASAPTSSTHHSDTADSNRGSQGLPKQSIGAILGGVSGAGVIAACIFLVRRLFFTPPKIQRVSGTDASDSACQESSRAVAPEISRFSADS